MLRLFVQSDIISESVGTVLYREDVVLDNEAGGVAPLTYKTLRISGKAGQKMAEKSKELISSHRPEADEYTDKGCRRLICQSQQVRAVPENTECFLRIYVEQVVISRVHPACPRCTTSRSRPRLLEVPHGL